MGLENWRFGKGDAAPGVTIYSFGLLRYSTFRPAVVTG